MYNNFGKLEAVFESFFKSIKCGVSKDAEYKIFNKCTIILEN